MSRPSHKATQMRHFNFHQKLKKSQLRNSQMHQTFHNILMHVTKVSTNNTRGRLRAGKWVTMDVNIVIFICRLWGL